MVRVVMDCGLGKGLWVMGYKFTGLHYGPDFCYATDLLVLYYSWR